MPLWHNIFRLEHFVVLPGGETYFSPFTPVSVIALYPSSSQVETSLLIYYSHYRIKYVSIFII